MTLLFRAVLLRCPRCGDAGFHCGWLRLRSECLVCGLERERGEHDFFLGAMMFNLIAAETLFALVIAAWVVLSWPAPPWGIIFVSGGILMLSAPVVLYPFSKMLWLAVDLIFRPGGDDTSADERPLRPPRPMV